MDLTEYVKRISLDDFGKPFHHHAVWNSRLTTTGGRFFPNDGHLDFSTKIYQEHGPALFRKIVRHELCHYHLFFEKRGYRHRDKDFKDLLRKVDGIRYVPRKIKAVKYHYVCQACGFLYPRHRRIKTSRYRCSKCQNTLILKNHS